MQNLPDILSNKTSETTSVSNSTSKSKKVDEKEEDTTGEVKETDTEEEELQSLEIENDDTVSLLEQQCELTLQTYQMQIEQYKLQIANIQQELKNIETERSTLLYQMYDPDIDISSIISQFSSLSSKKLQAYTQIQSITSDISSTQLKMLQEVMSTQASLQQANSLSSLATSLEGDYASTAGNIQNINTNSEVGEVAAQMGSSFIGVINNDAQGNAEFSPGGVSQAWCADFVTSITKRAYEAKGMQVPSGFGSSAVAGLRSWGQSNNVYLDTASNSNKANAIAQNVKPGDIMIQKRNGASHTGIVTKVYSDGSFDTVEGNSSDAVKARHYTADSNVLSGFVLMNALKV